MLVVRAIKLLAVGVLLGATWSSPVLAVDATPAGEGAPIIDACKLLDAANIQKVVGVAVESGSKRDAGRESNGAYSSACVWTFKDESGLPIDPKAPLGG